MRDALVTPLLDAALRGAVVLLIALAVTLLLHRRSAALRHAIWAGAIAAQLVLLALAVWGPRWPVAAPEVVSALVPPPSAGVPAVTPANATRRSSVTREPGPGGTMYVSGALDSTARRTDTASSIAPTPAAAPVRHAPSLWQVLLALWTLGAAAVLLRLGIGTVIVARLARRGSRVDDGGWLSLAQRLASALRIDRPLTLMRGDRLGVPVTWGVVYPVVLLPDDADEWPEERRRYVLVHEMAHVKRLDALTQLVGQVALALFWFDPLLWIAVRRMQLEREHACDDYVLRHGIQPSRYAADLLEMVQSLGTPAHRAAQPAFAALAMARRSEFEGRMLSILDPVLDRHPLHRGRTLMGALASLLLIVPLAALQPYRAAPQAAPSASVATRASAPTTASRPANDTPLSSRLQSLDSARRTVGTRLGAMDTARARIATATTAAASRTSSSSATAQDDDSCERFQYGNSSQTSFHMHADDDDTGHSTIRYLDFDQTHCRAASIQGKIVTSENEDRIVDVLPAGTGRAYFRERTGATDRELTFSNGGAILYRVNGVERPYDDEGRRWLAALLPHVLAEAAINVEPRVKRWRAQGGADNALRHVADLRSSGAKRAHYDALLDTPLSGPELDRLVRQAGKDVPSSGDLRAVLSKAATQSRTVKVQSSTLEEAMGAVPSSGDLTAVLLAFAQTDDREQLLAVARTALKIPSSGDLSRFLVDVTPRYLGRNDAALRDAYFTAVAKIPSSGDLARVLDNTIPYAAKSADVARAVIAGATKVPSSGDRSRVLVALATSGAVRRFSLDDAYLAAVREIPSSTDMRLALEALTAH